MFAAFLFLVQNAFMISKSVEETRKMAEGLVREMQPRPKGAFVLALSGDLGSGKTTFTKALAASLGVLEDEVTSPTFVIMKNYELEGMKFDRLIHIDAYRLEKREEIERIGFNDLLLDKGNLVLIEWPENIGDALPKNAHKISFKFIDENTREIVFN
jgi:tRNA threonylcarbamoyladenosine biosynthesis protein TsaE